LTEERPLRLAFRAREGWRVCRQRKTPPSRVSSEGGVGGGGVSTENPSVSQFKRGRGWWWCVDRRNTPPSRISSEGGVVMVVMVCRQRNHPLRLAFRAREGWWWWWWWCVDREIPPPSCISSEGGGGGGGGVSTEKPPPPSRVSSEGGVVMVVMVCRQRNYPLHLAFRAREGVMMVMVVVCRQRNHPLRLAFRAREGWWWWWWCVNRENTPSVSRFERGRGWRLVIQGPVQSGLLISRVCNQDQDRSQFYLLYIRLQPNRVGPVLLSSVAPERPVACGCSCNCKHSISN